MKKIALMIVLAVSLILTGCGAGVENANESNTYQTVNIEEAKKLIDNGITIVDVRTDEEYKAGHIPASVLVPLDQVEQRLNEFDEDTQYLIVCRSGNRSGQASDILYNAGIKNIFNMDGGMNMWDGDVEVN